MRGSRTGHLGESKRTGIIPAHAGLTYDIRTTWRGSRDHPRACGAHFWYSSALADAMGSSPRMRGSLQLLIDELHDLGIIPAHAGLTRRLSIARSAGRDHPRACGAHSRGSIIFTKTRGSSPRMRGSRIYGHSPKVINGIIPAHAGLTIWRPHPRPWSRDHPRACGAHGMIFFLFLLHLGSSPRMRGSPAVWDDDRVADGIIPAHAGLTGRRGLHRRRLRDHPRACGAHSLARRSTTIRPGSSPRMRGSLVKTDGVVSLNGIIPAHAGLTHNSCCCHLFPRDHPRACGAHCLCIYRRECRGGSSPRMRGSLKNPNNDAILSVSNPIFYSVLRVIL